MYESFKCPKAEKANLPTCSYPARYLDLFCASMVEIIKGQVKVSLYRKALCLHHSLLKAAELKWCIICKEILQKRNKQINS